jgi:hypothetical protein
MESYHVFLALSSVNWNDKGDIANEWFSFDFTLEELRTLRQRQVLFTFRPDWIRRRVVSLERPWLIHAPVSVLIFF